MLSAFKFIAMLGLSPFYRSARHQSPTARNGGFTFVEVLISVMLLGLLAAGSIWGLNQANNYASVSRLYTGAENVAQNQIDQILSEAPFEPQKGAFPPALKLGTTIDPEPKKIYEEPSDDPTVQRVVLGTVTTTVSKVVATGTNGVDLNLYQATVIVAYSFRGRPYKVQLNAMRASDT